MQESSDEVRLDEPGHLVQDFKPFSVICSLADAHKAQQAHEQGMVELVRWSDRPDVAR